MRKIFALATGLTLVATSAWSQGPGRDRDYGFRGGRDDPDFTRGRPMSDEEDDKGARGTRFFVGIGESRLAVTCAERESMRTCVDTALSLFERFRSQQPASPGASSPPGR